MPFFELEMFDQKTGERRAPITVEAGSPDDAVGLARSRGLEVKAIKAVSAPPTQPTQSPRKRSSQMIDWWQETDRDTTSELVAKVAIFFAVAGSALVQSISVFIFAFLIGGIWWAVLEMRASHRQLAKALRTTMVMIAEENDRHRVDNQNTQR